MSEQRIRNDLAWEGASLLLKTIAPALRPEEHPDAFEEFLRICKGMLKVFANAIQTRNEQRLEPSSN